MAAASAAVAVAFAERRAETVVPAAGYEALFLEHLAYVERVVAFLVRRHELNAWDAQDLDAWVKFRLLQDDYAVLRKFKGRSSLTTYLTTVICNLHRDFRIQRWGKWRESAAAKRCGEIGVQLETLLYRDGYSFPEAIRILRENLGVEFDAVKLERIAARLRPRPSRRFETEEGLVDAVAVERSDASLLQSEQAALWARLLDRVRYALEEVASEDRLILRLRFDEGLTIAAIARELELDQRRLYARVNRLLRNLRVRLEGEIAGTHRVSETRDCLASAAG